MMILPFRAIDEKSSMADVKHDPRMKSTVQITVIEARNLPVADIGGSSDPYVLLKDVHGISIPGSKGVKTSVKKKTLNPVWNESFPPFEFNYKLAKLVFKIYDHDTFSSDDILCKCTVPTETFLDGQVHDQWFMMKPKIDGLPAAIHAGSRVGIPELHLRIQAVVHIPLVFPGAFIPIPSPSVVLGLGWDTSKKEQIDLDASLVGLDAVGNIVDKVYYRNLKGFGGAVVHKGDNRTGKGEGDDEEIMINLAAVPPNVVALVVLIDSFTKVPLTKVKSAYCRIVDGVSTATTGFCRLSKMTEQCGLFFGCFYREAATQRFFFRTAAIPCHAGAEAVPALMAYLKSNGIV